VTSTDSDFFPEQVIVSSFKHAYNQLDVLVTSIALKFPRPMPSALTNITYFLLRRKGRLLDVRRDPLSVTKSKTNGLLYSKRQKK